MRDPSGHTSLPSYRRCGTPTPRDIATSGSYYGVTGPIRAVSVPSATLLTEANALRRHIELGACVTIGPHKSAKFRRCGTPTLRDNRDFKAPIMG
ncbi:hypothetical protein DPMN_003857 [Dreissena polymorpha]|uniref:Uncharacterized protein n=1 Tax=Dreissena polymorpha TaxID=45954 RepID=A0A9D4RSG3_DREPO|nr:hypothetical protein DPMN_003857 [Dreissena polymorpha]